MSDIVFILGAGASRAGGGPLMSDFLYAARRISRYGMASNRGEHFRNVFRIIGELQSVHSKAILDIDNIESLFSVFEFGKILKRLPGCKTESDIDNAISDLKLLIGETIENCIYFGNDNSIITAPQPYPKFAELVINLMSEGDPSSKWSTSVISFNYDLALDVAFHHAGLKIDYGFDGAKPGLNTISLLKLHGSMGWAVIEDPEKRRILPIEIDQLLSQVKSHGGKFRTLPVSEAVTKYTTAQGLKCEPHPMIVPPSWNKVAYYLGLSDVWASAARHLSEARHIFVIGYSLPQTDSFFQNLYALGSTGQNPLESFEVFDPDKSGSVKRKFESLLGPGTATRFKYHEMKFSEAIEYIKPRFPKYRGIYKPAWIEGS